MKLVKNAAKKTLLALPGISIFDALVDSSLFWAAHGRFPRKGSGLFNDHMFFLKLSREMYSPLRQFVSDKQLVKIFYQSVCKHGDAPKTLGQVFSYEEFLQTDLPPLCVIKPAHFSGAIFYDQGRGGLSDVERHVVERWFKSNLYDAFREKNYRYLRPSIIFEEYISDIKVLKDYKIFCVVGEPKAVSVHTGRHSVEGHRMRIYDPAWNPYTFQFSRPLADLEGKPPMLEEALEEAARIAKYFSFVRVDVYLTADRVIMGELTNVPGNAHDRMVDLVQEKAFADLLELNAMALPASSG